MVDFPARTDPTIKIVNPPPLVGGCSTNGLSGMFIYLLRKYFLSIETMDILRQIQSNRIAKGLDNTPQHADKAPSKAKQKKEQDVKERATLKEMRAEIIDKKPSGSKVKKYFKEVIERFTDDSSDDDGK
jgi:hypothetical protein